jgi:hypothetical protein
MVKADSRKKYQNRLSFFIFLYKSFGVLGLVAKAVERLLKPMIRVK